MDIKQVGDSVRVYSHLYTHFAHADTDTLLLQFWEQINKPEPTEKTELGNMSSALAIHSSSSGRFKMTADLTAYRRIGGPTNSHNVCFSSTPSPHCELCVATILASAYLYEEKPEDCAKLLKTLNGAHMDIKQVICIDQARS